MKLVVTALCLVAAPVLANPASDAKKAIGAANVKWMEAIRTHDAKALASLYAEDAVLLPANAPEMKGREAIEKFFSAPEMAGVKDIKLTTVELEVRGDVAIEVGRWSLSLQPPNAALIENADHGKALVVWKRQNGQWQMWRDIWNSSVAPKGPAETAKADSK